MIDVLMGREPPPIDKGVSTLLEVASAYHARGLEIESLILQKEQESVALKGGRLQQFRTGEMRRFVEMAKGAADLGSRRVTVAQMLQDSEKLGRDQ